MGRLLLGKKNDSVGTPQEVYDWLNKQHAFDFDPCPLERPEWDGLSVDWKSSNFVNPPYSEIKKWLAKGLLEREKGRKSVFLITARINTRYWFDLVWGEASQVLLLEGGIKFKGYANKLPVPMAVVVFDPSAEKKNKTFTEWEKKSRFILF